MAGNSVGANDIRGMLEKQARGQAVSAGEDAQQREQIQRVIQKVMGLFEKFTNQHTPIAKALADMGIPQRVQAVEIDGKEVVCLVIPAEELMHKEYQFMTGIDVNTYKA